MAPRLPRDLDEQGKPVNRTAAVIVVALWVLEVAAVIQFGVRKAPVPCHKPWYTTNAVGSSFARRGPLHSRSKLSSPVSHLIRVHPKVKEAQVLGQHSPI